MIAGIEFGYAGAEGTTQLLQKLALVRSEALVDFTTDAAIVPEVRLSERLALLRQDMAAFGARRVSELAPQRSGVGMAPDWFA